jgi:Icc-related predicted phosphoesterase
VTRDGRRKISSQLCFFASDLHGDRRRYDELFAAVERDRPSVVLLGGDLLPHHWSEWLGPGDFIGEVLSAGIHRLRDRLGESGPRFLLILGNDDERAAEEPVLDGEIDGLWTYLHQRWDEIDGHPVLGYANVPPTPFLLKDWERYDVSRYTDPGSVSPETGRRSMPVDPDDVRFGTIAGDLKRLVLGRDLESAIVLFHSPPYKTALDRAALDGQMVDHVPLDVHVGSIAIQRFIEDRQPLLTLHGHIHESTRLTGAWREQIGRTWAFSAAHDGPELALVRFELDDLESATRELI